MHDLCVRESNKLCTLIHKCELMHANMCAIKYGLIVFIVCVCAVHTCTIDPDEEIPDRWAVGGGRHKCVHAHRVRSTIRTSAGRHTVGVGRTSRRPNVPASCRTCAILTRYSTGAKVRACSHRHTHVCTLSSGLPEHASAHVQSENQLSLSTT